ncbi:SUF system Fe-S cluster assembly regulator [Stagnimonas aquatica]|uniref:SUF system Fe-S cluster assembly regulator n=1 Tax=Stagnimonas aquatica TaxID=2689987 RepID=A0A3N0V9T8_9GAMM|nr:SUF system Fe-S cluster assembly regulator [Stagnimonas aquatica]ROH89469.1 SUF system Fe-S cluster assembly regulator [Stagnimonas aquatica]
MLKLGKLTDYATVLLAAMAAEPERLHAALELSGRTSVAAPTVAKLLKQLQKGGLVQSARGAHGGYRLARAPGLVTVADVIRALEGPIAVTDCAVHDGGCAIEVGCAARAPFRLINAAVTQALEAVTLADMAASLSATPRRPAEVPLTEVPILFHPANSRPTSQVRAHVRRR